MKNRLNNLSFYRLIATLCVLQFHIFFILYNRDIPYETLLSKGVQGLTALSGFLYSQKFIENSKKFYLNALKKLLIPALLCFVFIALWDLIYMFISKDWNYISLFFDYRVYNGGLLFQLGNYYYIAYIFICYLITPILQKNNKCSLLVALSVIFVEIIIGFFFGPSIIVTTYIIGYYIGKKWFAHYVDNQIKYRPFILISWLLVLAISLLLFVIVNTYHFSNGYFLSHLESLTTNVLATIFGVSTFFFIAYLFRFLNKFKSSKFLGYTDKLCLIIYLMNQAFMCGAMNVTILVTSMWAKTLLVYIFTIVISCLLERINHLLSNKIFRKRSV